MGPPGGEFFLGRAPADMRLAAPMTCGRAFPYHPVAVTIRVWKLCHSVLWISGEFSPMP